MRREPADLEHGELVFRDGVEIWKDPKGTGQPVPQARRARRELGTGYVVNAGGGDELGGDREIALVEDVLDQAARGSSGPPVTCGSACGPTRLGDPDRRAAAGAPAAYEPTLAAVRDNLGADGFRAAHARLADRPPPELIAAVTEEEIAHE